MGKGSIRLLTIVAIIALFVGAWYTLTSESAKNVREYNSYLETAREKKGLGLNDDAKDFYLLALEKKDTLELRKEIADFYKDSGKMDDYVSFCDSIIDKYPKEEEGYLRMVNYFLEKKDYNSTFNLINKAEKRGIKSSTLSGIKNDIKFEYEYIGLGYEIVGPFSNGLATAKKYDGNWGYVSLDGKTVLSFKYTAAQDFNSSSLAAVQYSDGTYKIIDSSGRDKHVDADNKPIEDCQYLIEDKMAVKYNGKYHYCSVDFKELFGSYDYAGSFYNGIAAVKDGNKWYFIKSNGEKYIDKTYEEIVVNDKGIAFRNDVAFVKTGGKYILIDKSGNQVGNESWTSVDAFNSDQPAAVSNGSRWGFVDTKGNIIVDYEYGKAKSFSNGFAAVAKQDVWGYIVSSDYSIRIDYAFKDANDFSNKGTAFVKKDNGWDLIKIYSYNQ